VATAVVGVTGPYGAGIDPRPRAGAGCAATAASNNLRLPGEGSVICGEGPGGVCRRLAPWAVDEMAEDEINRLIGRAQRMLIDWHRDHDRR
jgi:hypothetical protein